MDQRVHNFIMLTNHTIDVEDRNLFWNMTNSVNSDSLKEFSYISEHPEILTMKLGKHHTVFDYFYDIAVYDRCHPSNSLKWQKTLGNIVQLVGTINDGHTLKNNRKYVLRLQGSTRSFTDIFSQLVHEEFDMGDPEFLVYSIIARGELEKLEIMSSLYVIEDYPGVLDVALRYGRNKVLQYFKEKLKLDFSYYGKILDFENYVDNPRYLIYSEQIARDETLRKSGQFISKASHYLDSIKLILETYPHPITCRTVEKWCELTKTNDVDNSSDIIMLLVSKLNEPPPLTYDFGSFNSLIHGTDWNDRSYLIERCLYLQNKLEEQEYRYQEILTRYRTLQERQTGALGGCTACRKN